MGLKLLKVLFFIVPLLVFSVENPLAEKVKPYLYRKGVAYLQTGNYIGALEIFHFLGNYRNSQTLYRAIAKFFSPIPAEVFKSEPLIRVAISRFTEFELICPQRVEKVSFEAPTKGSFGKLIYRRKVYEKLTLKGERGCRLSINGNNYGNLPLDVEIDLVQYRGSAFVVLKLPLEFYLKGVLPSEVYTYWPLEALKVQAVASRTYALFNIYRAREAGRPFDVDSTTNYQVFRLPRRIFPKVAKAVDETRGEVITYKGSLIYAMFHSNSGGCTHSFEEITGLQLPYLSRVRENCDLRALKWSYWNKKLSKRWLKEYLSRLVGYFNPVDVRIERNSCGRGLLITFLSERGEELTLPLAVFFRLEARIPSDWFFVIGKSGKDFILSGRGFGHGLGMSQWGAFCLSQRGWDYKRILKFYYRHTEIRKIY